MNDDECKLLTEKECARLREPAIVTRITGLSVSVLAHGVSVSSDKPFK